MKIEDLFEMSNIRKSESGLPVNIYVSSGGSVNHQHGPQIKAMIDNGDKFNPHNTISILLKKDITKDDVVGYELVSPDVVSAIRDYINLNYNILLAYWNDEISTKEMIMGLQKL
jgi:hypothetical protein